MYLEISETANAMYGLVIVRNIKLPTKLLYNFSSTFSKPSYLHNVSPCAIGGQTDLQIQHAKLLQHIIHIFGLANENFIISIKHFNSNKVFHQTQITRIKLLHHGVLEINPHLIICGQINQIINIKINNKNVLTFLFEVKSGIILDFLKSIFFKIFVNS